MKNSNFYTIKEIAEILGISRIAVYKKVKKGQLKAIKIGRNFAIPKEKLQNFLGKALTEEVKKKIDKAVEKTVKEYGEVLKQLGRE